MWTNAPSASGIRRDQYGVHHLVLPVLAGRWECCWKNRLIGSMRFQILEYEASLISPL
jgi:hypothetical protein